MKPRRSTSEEPQGELFGTLLERIISKGHALVRLSGEIDWGAIEQSFGEYFDPGNGRPAIATRMIVGMEYLKYSHDLSDEEVIERWCENPYWQYFCGEKYFRHEPPIHYSSLSRFRKRIGESGAEKLLEETIKAGLKLKIVKQRDFQKLNVDTTVQEKAIDFPTDAKLYNKMRAKLVRICAEQGVELRQKYPRKARVYLIRANRYFHAKQFKRGRKEVKKLRTILGRVVRDIGRQINGNLELEAHFAEALTTASQLLNQQRDSKNKIYSIHAPEVECISKGKAHKRYEFGNKVSVAATSRSNFIVGVKSFHGNPYDGHTLKDSIAQVTQVAGCEITGDVFVDRGYRGHDYTGTASVHVAGKKNLSNALRRWSRRRSAIEPKISHMKHHSRMRRNFLLGKTGDQYNAILCGCGVNFRRLLSEAYQRLLFAIFQGLRNLLRQLHSDLSINLTPAHTGI